MILKAVVHYEKANEAREFLDLSRPRSRMRRKKKLTLWSLKRFYEDLKIFIKPSEAPQSSVKMKV